MENQLARYTYLCSLMSLVSYSENAYENNQIQFKGSEEEEEVTRAAHLEPSCGPRLMLAERPFLF